jgi:hypothetical protein
MSRLFLALVLVACTDPGPEQRPTPTAPTVQPVPTPPDPAEGWVRDVAGEPDPVAKGLYRRAVQLSIHGDHAGATKLLQQIREQHRRSRYAARLEPGGNPAATVGALALLVSSWAVAQRAVDPR